MNWTEEQNEIFDFVQSGQGSLYVNASAGSGKTTTILESIKRIQCFNAIFIAFNKHIKEELSAKLPLGVRAMTVHGICYKVFLNHYGEDYKLNRFKSGNLLNNLIKSMLDKFSKMDSGGVRPEELDIVSNVQKLYSRPDLADIKKEIVKLVSYAKKELIYVGDNGYGIIDDSPTNWNKLIKKQEDDFVHLHGDDTKPIMLDLAKRVLKLGSDGIDDCKEIDFDDMIYLPLVFNLKFPKYQVIFVDEIQDFNISMIEVVCRMKSSANTRLISVGDVRQLLYSFMGASRLSIKRLINEFDCDIKTLSYSFRCPKSVVKEAQIYNQNIKFLPNAKVGLVKYIDGDFVQLFKDDLIKNPENSVIMCRYNSPLMALSNQLIKANVRFQFSGVNNSKNSYIAMLAKITGDTLKEVRTNLDVYCKEELEKISNSDEHDRSDYMHFYDIYSSLSSILFGMKKFYSDRKNIKLHVLAEIDKLFNNKTGIKLSSIHAMKGLEADNVFFLDYVELKDKFIKNDSESDSNLLYVGVTRAKNNLYVVESDEKFKKNFYSRK